jgi:hypothetical protein
VPVRIPSKLATAPCKQSTSFRNPHRLSNCYSQQRGRNSST